MYRVRHERAFPEQQGHCMNMRVAELGRVRSASVGGRVLLLLGQIRAGGVAQAGHPGLGMIALGDDGGDVSGDTGQWTPCAVRQGLVHRSSMVCGHLCAVTIESRRKALVGASEENPICLVRWALAGPEPAYLDLAASAARLAQ